MATAHSVDTHDDVPRRVDAYHESPHFRTRCDCDRRPITRDLARLAIHQGDVEDNPVDRPFREWRFRVEVDGLEVVVAAGESEDPNIDLGIFTAFVDVVDPTAAWLSDKWSEEDVEVAALLQYLNAGFEDAVDGFDIRQIDIHDPIHYHGHILVCNKGHSDPFCLRCKKHAIDGDYWDKRPCYDQA